MKTKILLTFLIFNAFCSAQIVNIPDKNFKAELLKANVDTNKDGEIQYSEAAIVLKLNIGGRSISNLTGIEAFINLTILYCGDNRLSNLDITKNTNLTELTCDFNQLSNLDTSNNIALTYLNCSTNKLSNLDISKNIALNELACVDNQLLNIDVSKNIALTNLACSSNHLSKLDVTNNTKLTILYCFSNQLSNLDVSKNNKLTNLSCSTNQLLNLDVSNNTKLTNLHCFSNQLSNLDLSKNLDLQSLECSQNKLTHLDISQNKNLPFLYCSDNQLISIFAKNGTVVTDLNFNNNPNLQYICVDDINISSFQNKLKSYGYKNCHLNSYCSFIPGGTFYSIQGNIKFDLDANGCDDKDMNYPHFKCTTTDSTNTGSFISNNSGVYSIPFLQGKYTISPVLENPTYFNINPNSLTIDFPTENSPFIQDFCITVNEIYNDLEIVLLPIEAARPGFDANYKLIYKNKGNTVQSGSLTFNFNDDTLDFVSAVPSTTNQSFGQLSWTFSDLLPFESREIKIVLNLNSPMEIPALNSGDVLTYVASINGKTDVKPIDNTFSLNQMVVNSYDPNDKTCLEGPTITPSMIGEYVHYMIRFENTGTFPAENVVVKDIIDTKKFDINSLIPVKASHNFETKISETNKVEFIFKNINLPFDDANNDGYITFKIKTLPSLTVNDSFSNLANIYFDYNFPITTNNYITTIENPLGLQENTYSGKITFYPNPVKNILNFQSIDNIVKVEIYDVSGRKLSSNTVSENKIDVSELKTGNYIFKLFSNKGVFSTKVNKE